MSFGNNISRTILSVIICLFIYSESYAAEIPDEKGVFSLGVTGSFHLNTPGDLTSSRRMDDFRFGYGGGIGMRNKYLLSGSVYIEGGAELSCDNLKVYDAHEDVISHEITKFAFSLSFNAGWQFDVTNGIKFAVFGSVMPAVNLGGSLSRSTSPLLGHHGVWNRCNLSAGPGFGILIDNVSIETTGYFGLINAAKNRRFWGGQTINDSVVKVSATYFFHFRRRSR